MFPCSYLALKSFPFLSLGFSAIFLFQLSHLVSNYLHPSELNTVMEVDKLDKLGEFPLIFQICVRPGLNMTELTQFGYKDVDSYFWGQTRGSDGSDVGWDGKDASISPAGKGRHPKKKNVFFPALPESPKPPPPDPNSGNLVLFFGRQKRRFARMTEIFFYDDNDSCNDNYDDNFGNFDDDYDKND